MTADEAARFGAEIALAIRAHGQMLADKAGAEVRELVTSFFDEAAKVAEFRTQMRRIEILSARGKTSDTRQETK